MTTPGPPVHTVAVVVPVYQGELTLDALIAEIHGLTKNQTTPGGRAFRVTEVLLVHDRGPDRSDVRIRKLSAQFEWVRPVWLSRNFGQHAATLAGMASTAADWIVTLDEDGQHDPAYMGSMLDVALDQQVELVYGKATNSPPHGFVRNVASRVAQRLATSVLASGSLASYSSYRLVLGELGRSVAAFSGQGTYLDVALTWVIGRSATCPIELRHERGRPSGYNFRSLLSHFWRLVITSGTKPLRVVSILGVVLSAVGLVLAGYVTVLRLFSDIAVQGWASVIVVILIANGVVLFSLGVISEYVGVAVRMAMGRPTYLLTSDPAVGPLGREVRAFERDSPSHMGGASDAS
jgi:undecaprenyl-phosphate 4-deoxy-4-formamido-L-arabinose transferase